MSYWRNMKKSIYCAICLCSVAFGDSYALGHGYKFNDALNVGAYFSIDYAKGDSVNRLRVDDLAVLAYGNFLSNFSYLAEFEAAPFYVQDYKNDTSESNPQPHYERLYLHYTYSDALNLRLGKFITPIGYWNLEPINVLRDTSSNPLYSSEMFPKFVSGADVSGFIDQNNHLKYHIFLQATDDLDPDYINIRNNFFTGIVLNYSLSYETDIGASLDYYQTNDNRDVAMAQVNAKYDGYPFSVQTEWAYDAIANNSDNTNTYQIGGYLQGMYNFTMEHAVVGRYEYFKDTQTHVELAEDNIGIIGYSYRPWYAVSLKGEYQFHSQSELNKAFISFSVLF